jgi:hypothetical protein
MNFLTIDPYLDYIMQGGSTVALPFRETHEEVCLFIAQQKIFSEDTIHRTVPSPVRIEEVGTISLRCRGRIQEGSR